jgi:hypothetical protein
LHIGLQWSGIPPHAANSLPLSGVVLCDAAPRSAIRDNELAWLEALSEPEPQLSGTVYVTEL